MQSQVHSLLRCVQHPYRHICGRPRLPAWHAPGVPGASLVAWSLPDCGEVQGMMSHWQPVLVPAPVEAVRNPDVLQLYSSCVTTPAPLLAAVFTVITLLWQILTAVTSACFPIGHHPSWCQAALCVCGGHSAQAVCHNTQGLRGRLLRHELTGTLLPLALDG
jgi:hypothetical protein